MKKIIQLLYNLNFSQYEAQAYIALLTQENVSGYELAKNSGIPASKIYQVLKRLLEKEIIVALDSEPIKYAPIPPQEVLFRLKGDYLYTFNKLGDALDNIYQKQQISNNYIWNISGKEAIMRRVTEFLDQARGQAYLSVWDEEIGEIRQAISAAYRRGVDFSIVHYGQITLGVGSEYRHGREHQIRQQRGARRIAVEIDEEKVILGHFLEDGSGNAVWTTNKGLVLLAKDYIIHDIYTIRMAEKFGSAADEIFESHK
jgi:sugar-specific transcriptional regulator TrmB